MQNASRPALPRLGSRVEVLPNKHGHDSFSGEHFVIEHAGSDVGLAKSPNAAFASFYVPTSRLDW